MTTSTATATRAATVQDYYTSPRRRLQLLFRLSLLSLFGYSSKHRAAASLRLCSSARSIHCQLWSPHRRGKQSISRSSCPDGKAQAFTRSLACSALECRKACMGYTDKNSCRQLIAAAACENREQNTLQKSSSLKNFALSFSSYDPPAPLAVQKDFHS